MALLTQYVLPFELVSILLLVGIVGAVGGRADGARGRGRSRRGVGTAVDPVLRRKGTVKRIAALAITLLACCTFSQCGALARLFPEVDRLWGIPQPIQWHPEIDTGVHAMMVLDMSARVSGETEVRFAALTHDLGKGTTPADILPSHKGHEERGVTLIHDLCERFRIPIRYRELAVIAARYHGLIHKVADLRPATIVDVLGGADAFRRPGRFEGLLRVCEADFRGRETYQERHYPQAVRWRAYLAAVGGIDIGAIARATAERGRIPERVREARVQAVRAIQEETATA